MRVRAAVALAWWSLALASRKGRAKAKKPPISVEVARLRKSKWATHCKQKAEPPGSFLVFTAARSGSRWFVNTLASRSGGHFSTYIREIALRPRSLGGHVLAESSSNEGCYANKPNKKCSCALREAFWNEVEAGGRHADGRLKHTEAPGYKYMMSPEDFLGRPKNGTWLREHETERSRALQGPPRINALVASVCDLRTPFIIFQRRNILRIFISRAANWLQPDKYTAHVRTAKDAKALRRQKPKIHAARLEARIRAYAANQRAIVDLFAYHCGPEAGVDKRVHYYEDLVDANPASGKNWGKVLYVLGAFDTSDAGLILERLGGKWPMSEEVAIHASVPVLQTMANSKEVERALNGTEFDWMLRE